MSLSELRELVMDREAWRATVHGVTKSWTQLSAMQETLVQLLGQEDPPEKEMATHLSILAWRIPRREEPGGLQSMESQWVIATT